MWWNNKIYVHAVPVFKVTPVWQKPGLPAGTNVPVNLTPTHGLFAQNELVIKEPVKLKFPLIDAALEVAVKVVQFTPAVVVKAPVPLRVAASVVPP